MNADRWRQVDRIFQDALGHEPHERASFLDEVCAHDPSLRTEVEALIRSDLAAASFLKSPVVPALLVPPSQQAGSLEGKVFGQYLFNALLGSGGMGEVYRATDSKLKRDVAIKVLPSDFSGDAERLVRFQREAEVQASLNHPHIAAIYDLATFGEIRLLILELVEGETLADRISRGPIPIDEALRIAKQVAEALEAAHEKGIIHRDLKPANIKITPDDEVKVLDFGLARVLSEGADQWNAATKITVSMPGSFLGTAAYMSPEQAKGKQADRTADVWAFGCVLYEMLTGHTAFPGETVGEIFEAIFKSEPDWSRLPGDTPEAMRRLLRRCLQKDQTRRFRDIRDARLEIDDVLHPTAQVDRVVQVPSRASARASSKRLGWIVAGILMLVVVALAAAYAWRPSAEAATVRSSILPPQNLSFRFIAYDAGPITVSPDGSHLAFVATGPDGKHQLWVRSLDSLSPQLLKGTDGASFPFWSPDSHSLGFFADRKLKKIDAAGGPAVTLSDASAARGGAWNRDGVIVFAPGSAGPLQRISASGGATSAVTQLEDSRPGAITHRWPYFLPDGEHFLYLSRGANDQSETGAVYVGSLREQVSKLLLRVSSNVAYTQGYLLFLREGTLMAQAFNTDRLELRGDAFPIAEEVEHEPSMASGVFAVSENGILAYQTGSQGLSSQLAWFDRTGKPIGMLGDAGRYFSPQLSPDEKKVTVSMVESQTGNEDVWLYEIERGIKVRFTVDAADEKYPVWSPDGSRIAYASNRNGHFDLYQKASNGIGKEELLVKSDIDKYPRSWSPSGALLYEAFDPTTESDLWILPTNGKQQPFPFLQTQFSEAQGQFSTDGKWIAYTSDESHRNEIYVAPFPGPGSKRQISSSGGRQPKWRSDGKELFFVSLDNKLMVAEVNGRGVTLEVGEVRPLFEVHSGDSVHLYDVTANGLRFLINNEVEPKSPSAITLVLNWTAKFRK